MSIQEHLNKIRNAIYGHEVRESIAKGIETAYDDASENGNANMEVKLARGTNPNLNARLNKMEDTDRQTTAQLAQKATKAELLQTNTELRGVDQRVDNLVIPISAENANIEVTDAHVSVVKGKTFDSLTNRLEDSETDVQNIRYALSPLSNAFKNSDFKDGTDGWTGNGWTTLSVSGDGLTGENVGSGGNFRISNANVVPIEKGDIIYVSFSAQTNHIKRCGFSGTFLAEQFFTPSGVTDYTYLITASGTGTTEQRFGISGAETGDTLTINKPIMINLTQTFGAGKEPTKEGVKELLSYVPNNHFDGSLVTSTIHDKILEKEMLKLKIENELSNGDFGSATSWGDGQGGFTVSGGVGQFTATTKYGGLSQYDKVTANHIYYLKGDIKATSADVCLMMGGTVVNHSGSGLFETLSLIHKATTAHGMFVQDQRSVDWTPVYVDNFILVDLTETFGQGFEPSLERFEYLLGEQKNTFFNTFYITNASKLLSPIFKNTQETSAQPEYVKPELEKVGLKVAKLQNENTHTFGFITDSHFKDYNIPWLSYMAEATNYMALDCVVHGGDLIDGFKEKDIELGQLMQGMKYFNDRSKVPLLFANGDHDDNNPYAKKNGNTPDLYIYDIELYSMTTRFSERDIVLGSRNKQYYYRDNEQTKVRTIIVNNLDIPTDELNEDGTRKYNAFTDKAYSHEQLNWIAHTALNFTDKETPTEWGVVIVGHLAGHIAVTNHWVVNQLLTAYTAGTSYSQSGTTKYGSWSIDVDYSTQGQGDFIAFFSGHFHRDRIELNGDGYTVIQTVNASIFKDSETEAPKKERGTVNETSFDIVTIDRQERKIYLTRYGAGEDRETTY